MKYIHFCTSTCLSFSTNFYLFQIILYEKPRFAGSPILSNPHLLMHKAAGRLAKSAMFDDWLKPQIRYCYSTLW